MISDSRRVVVAMSGGVDSSVAAALLQREGWETIGVTLNMQHCEEPAATGRSCCGLEGANRARAVAGRLGIPHYVLDCHREFEELVLRPSWNEYACGRTPNPCVLCNRYVKFGLLLDFAGRLAASRAATGHYARMETECGAPVLFRGADRRKDQSYFLFSLDRSQLETALFPLGGMTKADVRALARDLGLPNSESPESQDACFAGDEGTFAEILRRRFCEPAKPGRFVAEDGSVLGRHSGIHHFTVGQRRGLGLALGKRGWVKALRAENGDVVVSTEERELLSNGLVALHVNWHGAAPPGEPFRCAVQVRYRHRAVPALVEPDGGEGACVRFLEPVRAVTPGQAAVFYDGDRVLGGGWIESSFQRLTECRCAG